MHIASDRHLNEISITWRLNTVQVYKTHNHNLSHILKAHYTVTYVVTNFMLPMLCVSSADVDLWVNGGWDQPECPKAVNGLFPVAIATEPIDPGKICNY